MASTFRVHPDAPAHGHVHFRSGGGGAAVLLGTATAAVEPAYFIAPNEVPEALRTRFASIEANQNCGVPLGRFAVEIIAMIVAHIGTPDVKSLSESCCRLYTACRPTLRDRLQRLPIHSPEHLNREQLRCYRKIVERRESLCVLGEAGTGKSQLLRAASAALVAKSLILFVVAPTALAAQSVGGTTIHEFLALGIDPHHEDSLERLADNEAPEHPGAARARACDVLAIDEISMVRCELFEYLDLAMRIFRKKREEPFGGAQLVCFGDYSQLPPVPEKSSGERQARYAFESHVWPRVFGDPYGKKDLALLTQQMRQSRDPVLLHMLRRFRFGRPTQQDKQLLETRLPEAIERRREFFGPSVLLAAKSEAVREANLRGLGALDKNAKIAEYDARMLAIDPEFADVGYARLYAWQHGESADPLSVRVGARVVLTRNLREHRLCNKMLGTVRDIAHLGRDSAALYDRLQSRQLLLASDGSFELCYQGSAPRAQDRWSLATDTRRAVVPSGCSTTLPVVEFDSRPGAMFLVLPCTRTFTRPRLETREEARIAGHRKQALVREALFSVCKMPLVLGYAMTIRGVQGQTLQRARLRLSGCWMPEQVYVALSRVRSLRDLCVEDMPNWRRLYDPIERDDARPIARLNDAIEERMASEERRRIKRCGGGCTEEAQQPPAKKQRHEDVERAYGLEGLLL